MITVLLWISVAHPPLSPLLPLPALLPLGRNLQLRYSGYMQLHHRRPSLDVRGSFAIVMTFAHSAINTSDSFAIVATFAHNATIALHAPLSTIGSE